MVELNLLDFRDGNFHHFVNRIRKRPVQARAEQDIFPFADRFAEAQNDRLFLRADLEKTGAEKRHAPSAPSRF